MHKTISASPAVQACLRADSKKEPPLRPVSTLRVIPNQNQPGVPCPSASPRFATSIREKNVSIAEKTTSVSKLTGLLRIFAYEKQVELKERHAVVAEKNQETRQREADTRARLAALREVEVAHRMTRKQHEPNSKGASNKPGGKPTDGERVMSPAEVVLRACGTPGLFSRRVLPGERITDAIRRLYQILQDGQPLPPPIELKVSDASAAKTSAPNEPQLPLKGEKEILAQNEFSPVTAVCPLS